MKAAFFDVDGTLTQTRVWAGLTEYFKAHKKKRFVAVIFNIYHFPLMIFYKFKLFSITKIRDIWSRNMAWYFGGYTVEEAQFIWDWVITHHMRKIWRQDVREILNKHGQNGDIIVLVSGGPQGMVQRISDEVGADFALGTIHQIENGIYTGRGKNVRVCIDQNKALFAKELIDNHDLDIDLSNSFAYADSIGDIPLLEMVGNPVAVYPDEGLKLIAEERGWKIFPE